MKTLKQKMENKTFKVVRITKTEFELDNGDTYPHTFELDEDISVEEFQLLLDNSKQTIINLIQSIENE
jgi:hypothetical protein